MTWGRSGDRLSSEPMMTSILTHVCIHDDVIVYIRSVYHSQRVYQKSHIGNYIQYFTLLHWRETAMFTIKLRHCPGSRIDKELEHRGNKPGVFCPKYSNDYQFFADWTSTYPSRCYQTSGLTNTIRLHERVTRIKKHLIFEPYGLINLIYKHHIGFRKQLSF